MKNLGLFNAIKYYTLFQNTKRVCLKNLLKEISVKKWATKHWKARFKTIFQLWQTSKTVGFHRRVNIISCFDPAPPGSHLHHSGCPAVSYGAKGLSQIKSAKGPFHSSFLLFVHPLFCVLQRNGELIDEATSHFWWEKCLKTHAENSPSITFGECKGWWKYTKNLTFVFELLFKIFICAGKPIELEVSIHYSSK